MRFSANKDHSNVNPCLPEGETTSSTGIHGNPGLWAGDVELTGKELVRPGYLRSLQLDSLRQQPRHSPTVLKSRAISLFLLTAESCLLRVLIYSIVNLQLFVQSFSFISLLMLQELLPSLHIPRGIPDPLCCMTESQI